MKESLVFRADASNEIGTGHIMRCLALAQAWQDAGGCSTFVLATDAPLLEERLRQEDIDIVHLPVKAGSLEDAVETAAFAHRRGANWIVSDSYDFGADYQKAIKDKNLRL